jgi:hypothetical protein
MNLQLKVESVGKTQLDLSSQAQISKVKLHGFVMTMVCTNQQSDVVLVKHRGQLYFGKKLI